MEILSVLVGLVSFILSVISFIYIVVVIPNRLNELKKSVFISQKNQEIINGHIEDLAKQNK
jgi:hypothetical protein